MDYDSTVDDSSVMRLRERGSAMAAIVPSCDLIHSLLLLLRKALGRGRKVEEREFLASECSASTAAAAIHPTLPAEREKNAGWG